MIHGNPLREAAIRRVLHLDLRAVAKLDRVKLAGLAPLGTTVRKIGTPLGMGIFVRTGRALREDFRDVAIELRSTS